MEQPGLKLMEQLGLLLERRLEAQAGQAVEDVRDVDGCEPGLRREGKGRGMW